jgi:hypothetical protein
MSLGVVIAALVAGNPVVMYQMATSYVDGAVASSLTVFIVALAAWRERGNRAWLALGALSAVLVIGLKFTGLVYVSVVGAVFVVEKFWRGRAPTALILALVVAIGCGVALSGDAYVRNACERGGPFFPAIKAGCPDVLAAQANKDFLDLGRIEKVVRAMASPQYSDRVEMSIMPALRWPGTVWRWEHRYDPRFSGFGPFTLEVALLTLCLWFLCRCPISVVGVAVLAAALATDAGWWARLAPQWWLLPTLGMALGHRAVRRVRVWVEATLVVVMFANVVLVGAAAWRDARSASRAWAASRNGDMVEALERHMQRPTTEYVIRRRLRE